MNKRYEELNDRIQDWFQNKTQDILILQTLYAQCNLQHEDKLKGTKDIRNNTKFHNYTDKELVAQFAKNPFNTYSKEDLTHLMQEVHDRYIGENGWDVTRSVLVQDHNSPEEQGTFGYCCYANDLLFINKDMIDTAKGIENNSEPINAETVGKYFLDTIWHETKHVIQYEDGIDLALGRKQDAETAFSAAAMMVMMTNFNIAGSKNDYAYSYDWRSKYRVHFCEHEANYAALKKSEENTEESLKSNYDYQMYASDSAALALGFRPSTTDMKLNEEAVKNRVGKIESYLKTQIKYFESGLSDCPLKETVLNTVNAYMKVDENGNSPFRDRMTKEVSEIVDTYVVNRQKMEEADRKATKNNLKPKSKNNIKSQEEIDEEFMSLIR